MKNCKWCFFLDALDVLDILDGLDILDALSWQLHIVIFITLVLIG